MKTSEVFKACIPLIESGNRDFICHAIAQVYHGEFWGLEWSKNQCSDLKEINIIEEVVGTDLLRLVIQEIQKGFCDIFREDYGDWNIIGKEEMIDFRVSWLKSLVNEYELKGQ